jgi:hypothetical protein
MDDGQEPKVLDAIVSVMSSLLRSGSTHGVTADNIDEVMEKVGRVAGKFTTPSPIAQQPQTPSTTGNATSSDDVTVKTTDHPAPAKSDVVIKPSRKTTAKAKSATQTAKNKPTPTVTAPTSETAKTGPAVTVDQPTQEAKAKRGRKPKAVATPEISEEVVAAPPEIKRGPGRPKKVTADVIQPSQTTLFDNATFDEMSDDPKSPNYRFQNLMKNGKPVFFKNMKLSNAILGEEVTCMICGVHQMMLKKHLTTKHNMTGEQYMRFIGVDPNEEASKDYVRGPGFAKRKSAETKASGFGKHERSKTTAAVAGKTTPANRKATPVPTAETKKTRGRPKVTA